MEPAAFRQDSVSVQQEQNQQFEDMFFCCNSGKTNANCKEGEKLIWQMKTPEVQWKKKNSLIVPLMYCFVRA